MAEFLMKPKIDFAFKEIMMDEKARIGFLAAVLKIPPKEIKETWILNTALRKEHEDDKQGILDVRLLLNSDQEVDIEIQLSELRVWADRSLFYLSKMFTEQIRPGESYRVLKKCVGISILDFVLFKDVAQKGGEPQGDAGCDSCFHSREDSRHFIYTDKMEVHVIELPKLPQEVREGCSDIELWARFINAEKKEVFDMLAKNDPYIGSAYQRLQLISQDRQMRMEYETREKAIRDYNEGMLEAEERGEERGRKEGISIGEERGRKAEALSIARKLVGMGFPTEEIVKITLLSEKEIEGLH